MKNRRGSSGFYSALKNLLQNSLFVKKGGCFCINREKIFSCGILESIIINRVTIKMRIWLQPKGLAGINYKKTDRQNKNYEK